MQNNKFTLEEINNFKNIDDDFIKEHVISIVSDNKKPKLIYNKLSKEIKEYIENRFEDSSSFHETFYRIINNIEIRPVCKICNNKVSFDNKKGFKQYCCTSCVAKDKDLTKIRLQKQKEYNLKHYGVEHNLARKDSKEKKNNTMIERYGSNKMSEIGHKEKIQKRIEEKIKEFESKEEYYKYIENKKLNTLNEKYGVNSWSEFVSQKEIQQKINKTKKERHTFNTSSFQKFVYDKIKELYSNVIQEYNKDPRYPWSCDIFIPEIDTFIEVQGSWIHGGHPFNINNRADINKLNGWKSKNSEYYNNAINVWTNTDILKRETAKKNNLNYIELFNFEDFVKWLKEKGYTGEIKFKKAKYENVERYLEIPKCPICGKDCKRRSGIFFCKTCGDKECIKKISTQHIKESCLQKYGVDNTFKLRSTIENAQNARIKKLKNKLKENGIPKCPICGKDCKNYGIYNFLKTCGSKECHNKLIWRTRNKNKEETYSVSSS